MSGPTVLFRIDDGRDRLVRGLNLAREVLELVPDARVLVHTPDAAAARLCPPSVRCVAETGAGTAWRDVLAATAPDLAVYDTLVPDDPAGEPLAAHTRVATVLRRSSPDRHAELLAGGFLHRSDAIVVPHTRQEFDLPLPEAVERRTLFVGPLAQRPDPRQQEELRRRYALQPGQALLVSVAGGPGGPGSVGAGGAGSDGRFLATVRAVQAALPGVPRPVRHVVVLGPSSTGPLPEVPGATVVDVEPGSVDLFALADLVLSEGGPDAVSELRVAGTPAVFAPADRDLDGRHERVRALAELGAASVAPGAAPGMVAGVVTDLLGNPAALGAMRRRAAALPVLLGNRAAAVHLLGPLLRRGVA